MTSSQQRVFHVISTSNNGSTVSEIAESLGISSHKISPRTGELIKMGMIIRSGVRKTADGKPAYVLFDKNMKTQVSKSDAEEFSKSISQHIGASWRQILLAQKMGVPKALGLSVPDWVKNTIGSYAKLSVPDRLEAVKELTEEGLSRRQIADVLGVATSTIQRDAVPNGTNLADKTPETVPNGTERPSKAFKVTVRKKFESWLHRNWSYPEDNTAAKIIARHCMTRKPTREMKFG